jgi:fluoroquinolone resistance protein
MVNNPVPGENNSSRSIFTSYMSRIYKEDELFEKKDYTAFALPVGDYDNCTFVACNFSASDLSERRFSECTFKGCNLAAAKLTKTALQDTTFTECKLTGLHFEDCSEFLFTPKFEHCVLQLSSFVGRKLRKITFTHCNLQEVDFTGADLTGALFDQCDLARALFEDTVLEKADFRNAYNYSIDPECNKLKKARFSSAGLAGLLDKYDLDID